MICKTDGHDVIQREDGEGTTEAIRIVQTDGPPACGRVLYLCGTDFGRVCESDWIFADLLCRFLMEG